MAALDSYDLRGRGFEGFRAVESLADGARGVPVGSGVYAVLRDSDDPPQFLDRNPGSWFKRKDPTVPVDRLRLRWLDGPEVLYIGRAASLRERIALLAEFSNAGSHKSVFHWGGRLLWQVAGSREFLVAWKVANPEKPAEVELIDEFVSAYGALPFANLVRPRHAPSVVEGTA